MSVWAKAESKAAEFAEKNGINEPDLDITYRFALHILRAKKPDNRKDHRIEDAMAVRMLMRDYKIKDEASYAAAVEEINGEYYKLRRKIIEGEQIIALLKERLQMAENLKKYKSVHKKWETLPEKKKEAFYDAHRAELVHYEAAERFLNRCREDGETIDVKKWNEALKFCYSEKVVNEFKLDHFKDKIHSLELIKREFIREKNEKTTRSVQDKYDSFTNR